MQETYGYSVSGFVSFALNRALRLYPSYWVSLAISTAVILFVGADVASNYRSVLGVPDSASVWVQNIFLIYANPFPTEVAPRLSPATWALTIEVVFYILIGLGISRSRGITIAWFVLGLSWHLYVLATGLSYSWRYHFIPAGALPFSMGAIIYHYRDFLVRKFPISAQAIAVSMGIGLMTLLMVKLGSSFDLLELDIAGRYLNIANNAFLILLLLQIRPRVEVRNFDKFVGDFSYHLYILHWSIGLGWAALIFDVSTPTRSIAGVSSVMCAVIMCLIISLALTRYVDLPIERLRKAVKRKQTSIESPGSAAE